MSRLTAAVGRVVERSRLWIGQTPSRRRGMVLAAAGVGIAAVIAASLIVCWPVRSEPRPDYPGPFGYSEGSARSAGWASATPSDVAAAEPSLSPPPTATPFPISTGELATLAPDGPTPALTLPPGSRLAGVMSRVPCDGFQDQVDPNVADGVIYADCSLGSDIPIVTVALNPLTGKITGKYALVNRASPLKSDHGLWYTSHYGVPCTNPPSSSCFTPTYVYRADAATGKTTYSIKDHRLADDGLGYVWATDISEDLSTVLRIDPVTTQTKLLPWNHGDPEVACGSLWGHTKTALLRVDPDTGGVLATLDGLGGVSGMQQLPDGCWGHISTAAGLEFVKISATGIADQSVVFSQPLYAGDHWGLAILEDTFWRIDYDDYSYATLAMQRLDPLTWQPVGSVQLVRDVISIQPLAAGGYVWLYEQFDDGEFLVRTDISLAPLPSPSPSA